MGNDVEFVCIGRRAYNRKIASTEFFEMKYCGKHQFRDLYIVIDTKTAKPLKVLVLEDAD